MSQDFPWHRVESGMTSVKKKMIYIHEDLLRKIPELP